MNIVFTVAVRNPQWYWSKEEMKEEGDYRKEWEALNKGKVDKTNPAWQYEIPFDVKKIEDNRDTDYEIKLASPSDRINTLSYILNSVTVIKFIGETESLKAVVSNSLIYQYLAAKQIEYKHYVYIYLSANTDFYHPTDRMYWISAEAKVRLEEQLDIQLTD